MKKCHPNYQYVVVSYSYILNKNYIIANGIGNLSRKCNVHLMLFMYLVMKCLQLLALFYA